MDTSHTTTDINASELAQFGLSEDQAQIYYHLLKFGARHPSGIAQQTGVTRTTCYRILDSLNKQGLILRLRKGKKFYYEVANPKNFRFMLMNRERQINKQLEKFETVSPILKSMFLHSESLHNIEFYEGRDKYEFVMADALSFPGEPIYNFINIRNLIESFKDRKEQLVGYVRKRAKAEIKNYSIIPKAQIDSARQWSSWGYTDIQKPFTGQYRYIDNEKIFYSIYMRIYHDRIAFFDFESPKQTGIIIINQRLSEMMKGIFQTVWKISKPIQ